MPKNGFSMPTAKNGFHILNLHPKKYVLKKKKKKKKLMEKIQIKYILCIKYFRSQEKATHSDKKHAFCCSSLI